VKDFTSLFSRRREWDWGLILSFDLSPITFFETQLLNKLVVRRNLTVVIDARNLRRLIEEDQSKPRFAGVYYNIEGVELRGGGSFHPKLYLLAEEDEIWLAAGSFNVTETGFKKNLESLVEIRFERDKLDEDEASLLGELAEFLESVFVTENPLVAWRSECLRLPVAALLSSPMFQAVRAGQTRNSRTCHFLSSAPGPLLRQILDQTGQSRFTKVEALSPFYDSGATAIKQIASIAGQLALYVPEKNSSLPAVLFTKDRNLKRIPVFTVRLEENGFQRFCHAKLYRLHAGSSVWNFVTSANLTGPGMLNADFPRNMETGFLFTAEKKTAFPNVPNLVCNRVTDFSSLAVASPEAPPLVPDNASTDVPRILSAYYDGGLVRFSVSGVGFQADSAFVVLILDGGLDRSYIAAEVDAQLQFEPDLEIEGAKAIELLLEARDGSWKSRLCPVGRRRHEPNQLPALGASAFQRCVQIGGFEGIAEAFRLAATSGREDWLIYLLSHWDLNRILQGLSAPSDSPDTETEEQHTPTIREKHAPDFTIQQLRRNVGFIADTDLLLNHLKVFSRGVIETADSDLLRRLNDFCLPLCLEITQSFLHVLRREEQKKRDHPYMQYPEYTWGNNFHKYLRFAKLIVETLTAARASSAWSLPEKTGERWLFSVLATCWRDELHTTKTRQQLLSALPTIDGLGEELAATAASLIHDCRVSTDLHERAREVVSRYGHDGGRRFGALRNPILG